MEDKRLDLDILNQDFLFRMPSRRYKPDEELGLRQLVRRNNQDFKFIIYSLNFSHYNLIHPSFLVTSLNLQFHLYPDQFVYVIS